MEKPIRVLIAKPGLDGHDVGAKLVCRALMDAGMEVIYTGLRQSPQAIAKAALEEDDIRPSSSPSVLSDLIVHLKSGLTSWFNRPERAAQPAKPAPMIAISVSNVIINQKF